jgi:hypothetical protein
MSLELWTVVFSGATFVVIAATAIAALIQLRHMRAGNQLNALLTLLEMWDKPEMQSHIRYMRTTLQEKIKDPKFLAAYEEAGLSRADHPELLVADFWEQIGTFMKYGLIDERSWFDIASAQIGRSWRDLEPVVLAARGTRGPSAFENFEYLAVRAELWVRRSPEGYYPKRMPRMAQLKSGEGAQGGR